MKKVILNSFLLLVSAIIIPACNNSGKQKPEVVQPTAEQLVQRGEYLVKIMGCNDCHSPKSMGPQGPSVIQELMLSGYPSERPLPKVDQAALKNGWMLMNEDLTAAVGPWGISFAGNLTSDQTGIGNWTEENFKRALKEGKYKGLEGTRSLLPPMPWTNFTNISDDDVSAIFAYLKSTKPVRNVVPVAVPPEEIK
jgi:hypothetical protein